MNVNALLPPSLASSALHQRLESRGFTRIHQGKVRDTYKLPNRDLLLVVAEDRLSIFDFVLPCRVPFKGAILTALTVFWLDRVIRDQLAHHLVAYGRGIDQHLPMAARGDSELHQRGLIVRRLTMLPVECIVRGYLTGSGWTSYQKNGEVCGIRLPVGLHDGSRIEPIFTPTTKATVGHDQHLPRATVVQQYGEHLQSQSLLCYKIIADHAERRGVILADTKFEWGEGSVLGDEVGTPDASRFWDYREWHQALRKQQSPTPFDKELVRQWGKTVKTPFQSHGNPVVGINQLDPASPEHRAFVDALAVSASVISRTTLRYREVFCRLTDMPLPEFQKKEMGVAA